MGTLGNFQIDRSTIIFSKIHNFKAEHYFYTQQSVVTDNVEM